MIIHDVEQGTDEWHALRAGRPTSSEFSKLITGTGKPSTSLKDYANKLATESYLASIGKKIESSWKGNQYTDRGHELEPVSRAEYEMLYQTPVQEVGFITDSLMRWGASTDGLVADDGVVEFKNLIETTFFSAVVYWQQNGRTEPKYKPQAQGELFVTERKWLDLILFNPEYPEPIIERIYPDAQYQATLKTQLALCIAERDKLLKIFNGDKKWNNK
jgi:hypothetical protein